MADAKQIAWVSRVLGFGPRATERPPARSNPGIAYKKLLLRWRDAQAQARRSLATIAGGVLGMAEVQADPRFAKVQAALTGLPTLVPEFGGKLEDLLDQGINAGTNAMIAPEALKLVADYRARLAAVPLLAGLEAFAKPHLGDLVVFGALDGALAEMETTFKATS